MEKVRKAISNRESTKMTGKSKYSKLSELERVK